MDWASGVFSRSAAVGVCAVSACLCDSRDCAIEFCGSFVGPWVCLCNLRIDKMPFVSPAEFGAELKRQYEDEAVGEPVAVSLYVMVDGSGQTKTGLTTNLTRRTAENLSDKRNGCPSKAGVCGNFRLPAVLRVLAVLFEKFRFSGFWAIFLCNLQVFWSSVASKTARRAMSRREETRLGGKMRKGSRRPSAAQVKSALATSRFSFS